MHFSIVSGDGRLACRHDMWRHLLAIFVGLMLGGFRSPMVANAATGVQSSVVAFDIAAQPLASALDAYSAVTGLQVVYDGTLATGLRSKPVVGSMMPAAALRDLLDGTGLIAVYEADAFTIVPAPAQSHPTASLGSFMPYLAAIQGNIEQAFCQSRLTRPGGYRIKFQFWIGSGGEVLQPQLLGSTDNSARDEAIMRALAHVAIDRPPPPSMPQPVVMSISSRSPVDTGDCVEAANPGRSSP
jgi:hypothetical protein